jgi:2-oxoglutarate ferredoxin oxidoreductase subunit alpha
MARGQGDYFQATRGGGHGDYRHIVLAPADGPEAIRLVQLAFHLADQWRNPVMVLGDYYLAHVQEAVDPTPIDFGALPDKDWALDGSSSGSGGAKILSPLTAAKRDTANPVSYGEHLARMGDRMKTMEQGVEPLIETGHTEDAELIVVAYGTPGRYVRYVVSKMRAEGVPVGFIRPITLWPFPTQAVAAAAAGARAVAVYELNTGQMFDDVRLAVRTVPVSFIGGISFDSSGFGIAPDLGVNALTARVERALEDARRETA